MNKYPIIVRRWFQDGNSFAFHPSVTNSEISEIGRVIHPYGYEDPVISIAFTKGRRIIGELTAEVEFLDRDTLHRGCNVVKMMLVPDGKVSETDALEALRRAPLPQKKGPDPALLAQVGVVRELVPLVIDRDKTVIYLTAFAATLFAGAVFSLSFSRLISDFIGCFSLGVLFAGALLSELLSVPRASTIESYEMAIYRSSRDQRPLPSRMVDEKTKIDGFGFQREDGTLTIGGRLPFVLGDAEYVCIAVSSAQWTSTGSEFLTMPDGSRRKTAFVRVFVRKRRQWVLRYASWTADSTGMRNESDRS